MIFNLKHYHIQMTHTKIRTTCTCVLIRLDLIWRVFLCYQCGTYYAFNVIIYYLFLDFIHSFLQPVTRYPISAWAMRLLPLYLYTLYTIIPRIMSDSSACMVTPLLALTHAHRNHMSNMHTSLFLFYPTLQSHQLHLGLAIQLVFFHFRFSSHL